MQRELRIAIDIDDNKQSMLLAIMGELDRAQERNSGRYIFVLSSPGGSAWTASGSIKGCG